MNTRICPWCSAKAIGVTIIDSGILDTQYTEQSISSKIARCHVIKPLPTSDDWKTNHAKDTDTNYLISRLEKDKTPLSDTEFRQVNKSY